MLLWQADSSRRQQSSMYHFMKAAGAEDWSTLYRWSLNQPEAFWKKLTEFCHLHWIHPPSQTCSKTGPSPMLDVEWFPEGSLNFCENQLKDLTGPSVLTTWTENHTRKEFGASTLRSMVARGTAYLTSKGIQSGDRVAGILPNGVEALMSMLSTSALGATWSSCSPDFGAEGLWERLSQIQPKICFYTNTYRYNGKEFDCKPAINICRSRLPNTHWISIQDKVWASFMIEEETGSEEKITFIPTPFSHPLYIVFSSGTTGRPKCIVHSVGGTLLQHKKELMLHCDVGPKDTLLFYTTCGWMMWNWMASAFSVGARMVTYDGSLSHPDLSTLWKITAQEKVTVLGISPKFLATCRAQGIHPREIADFSALRTILSTGAPLLPEQYQWIYDEVKADVHVASMSGGTDILSCFMLGNPLLPVYPGEIQSPGLGMAISARHQDFTEAKGEKGELVCTQPFVSMPVGFLHDPEKKAYRKAYFEFFPEREVWRHGDYVEVTPHGGIIVHGRSDATLNPNGVRMGTAELYGQIESMTGVADSLAIGYATEGNEVIWLFLQLTSKGKENPERIMEEVRRTLRTNLSPRHVPARIWTVTKIPYTRSGKKMELAVKNLLQGEGVENRNAMSDPQALEEYEQLRESLCPSSVSKAPLNTTYKTSM